MDVADFIGYLSTVCTMLLFLTGVQICYTIYKKGTIGDISSLPFISMVGNCSLWFFYGNLVGNMQIMFVNAFGFVLSICYSAFYLSYTQNKRKLIHQLAFISISILVIYSYAYHYEKSSVKSTLNIGLLASAVSVIMFGSPLASLRHVMKTQSTESLSFSLCLANFVVASEWFIYGILINDYFVQIPNLLGAILGFSQLALFCKYPSQSIATKSKLKEHPISNSV